MNHSEIVGLLLQHSCGTPKQLATNLWAVALPSVGPADAGGVAWWTESLSHDRVERVYFCHEVAPDTMLEAETLEEVEAFFANQLEGEF